MFGFEIGQHTGAELVRFVQALGRHRYVASRLHLVHAFAIDAAGEHPALADAAAWAARVLGAEAAIDHASRDERLYRHATDAELVAVLERFWSEDAGSMARKRLGERLDAIGAPADLAALPFDETREDDVFPVLVDAGWELLPLAGLDPERHRGVIQSLDDFEVARFEEENAAAPTVTLYELPALGGTELLGAFGAAEVSRAPFVVWHQGNETYVDYVLRGVVRASKLETDT